MEATFLPQASQVVEVPSTQTGNAIRNEVRSKQNLWLWPWLLALFSFRFFLFTNRFPGKMKKPRCLFFLCIFPHNFSFWLTLQKFSAPSVTFTFLCKLPSTKTNCFQWEMCVSFHSKLHVCRFMFAHWICEETIFFDPTKINNPLHQYYSILGQFIGYSPSRQLTKH